VGQGEGEGGQKEAEAARAFQNTADSGAGQGEGEGGQKEAEAARAFLNTHDSADLRAANPRGLVGKEIEVGGRVGTVKRAVSRAGAPTLHAVEFAGGVGGVENIQLAKREGGEGVKFHAANT
jgi:hypothetical protein